jgi:hypothetical protein
MTANYKFYDKKGRMYKLTGEVRPAKKGERFIDGLWETQAHLSTRDNMKKNVYILKLYEPSISNIPEGGSLPFEEPKQDVPQTTHFDALMGSSGHLAKKASKSEQFRRITRYMNELYERKNADYGDSFSDLFKEFGLVSSCIRLQDKLTRFKTLADSQNQAKVKDESIRDTLIDMAAYAIMTVMELDNDGCSSKDKTDNF